MKQVACTTRRYGDALINIPVDLPPDHLPNFTNAPRVIIAFQVIGARAKDLAAHVAQDVCPRLLNAFEILKQFGLRVFQWLLELFSDAFKSVADTFVETMAQVQNVGGAALAGGVTMAAAAAAAAEESCKEAGALLCLALENVPDVPPEVKAALEEMRDTGKEVGAEILEALKGFLEMVVGFFDADNLEKLQKAVIACAEAGWRAFLAFWDWLRDALEAAVAGGRELVICAGPAIAEGGAAAVVAFEVLCRERVALRSH